MFTLFALVHDPAGAADNDTLIRDLQRHLVGIEAYQVAKKDLALPRMTVVDLTKDGWRVRFSLRRGESMTLGLPQLRKILDAKTALPEDFDSYDLEIAIGFGDDPDQQHTNDILQFGEFVRENYPGVVIFDQYNQDIW